MDLLLVCLSTGISPFSKQFIWQKAEFVTKGNVQGNTNNNNNNNNNNIRVKNENGSALKVGYYFYIYIAGLIHKSPEDLHLPLV